MKQKSVAVVEWKDFKKQSQSDIAACNLLYKSGDYGNAAYHLQQAVEKHTKAILLHGKLMPARKTHLPLSEFLEEFVKGIGEFETIAKKYNVQVFDSETSRQRRIQFLDQSRKVMIALAKRKPSFISALWKNSLGIPLVDRQEKAVFQQCPIFLRRSKLKIDIVYEYENDTAKDNLMNDSVIKRLDHYKPIVELGPMIAATFPHEEVGRYPTEIRTSRGIENSVELYKTHKGKLRKLIDTAEKNLTSR
jgi:HEPN domain-containing protein